MSHSPTTRQCRKSELEEERNVKSWHFSENENLLFNICIMSQLAIFSYVKMKHHSILHRFQLLPTTTDSSTLNSKK